MLDTIVCDKACQLLATGRWFSTGTPISSTNKADCHDITEILLRVALNTTYHKQSISVMPKMVSNRLLLNHLNPFHITLIFLLLYILSGIIPDVRQSAQEKNIDHMYLCRS